MIRRGQAVDAAGDDVYLPHLDRLAIPITFVHGEHNRMFIPRSTELTYDALRAANGDALYRRVIVPGYAHMDCWMGERRGRPTCSRWLSASWSGSTDGRGRDGLGRRRPGRRSTTRGSATCSRTR